MSSTDGPAINKELSEDSRAIPNNNDNQEVADSEKIVFRKTLATSVFPVKSVNSTEKRKAEFKHKYNTLTNKVPIIKEYGNDN